MSTEDAINFLIAEVNKDGKLDTNKIRDGYHSFGELYEHRITLFIALCRILYQNTNHIMVWKSKFHSNKSTMEGWFIMGIGVEKGTQMSYHLPNNKWEACYFAKTLPKAPEWDGHTPEDVLKRLNDLQ